MKPFRRLVFRDNRDVDNFMLPSDSEQRAGPPSSSYSSSPQVAIVPRSHRASWCRDRTEYDPPE